jgi:hypothetical protein
MFRALSVVSLVLTAFFASSGGATATAYPTSDFYVCFINNPCRDTDNYTAGRLTWYNRTVNVSGSVFNSGYYGVSAVFDAFQGSTRIDSQARGAGRGQQKSFGFDMGDPNLSGGVDRIRITLCVYYNATEHTCGEQKNYPRIGA